ncbi:hypothetical protein TWF696_005525 [Orbilia brochopaga]|uniref:poly(A)-specific ribonuclease n=1 Tax=Orbilia brochopaga TaxID=3140254 RepID=A0AAV9V4X0_9PEZI
MPPPSRGAGFGPAMISQPFGNQHLIHGNPHHASHHLAHHQMQPQHQQHLHQSHHPQHQTQAQHQQTLQQQVAHVQHTQQQHAQQVVHPQPTTTQQQQSIQQQAAAANTIKEVWKGNLEAEFAALRDLVEEYPYIAMDTEFPGIVARPIGGFRSKADYHYQTLRCNVDMLRIIQLGITFHDENGKCPEPISTWQFNFQFSLSEDMFAQESIDLLIKSGIDFNRHEEYGINVSAFGELLISSGLVLFDNVKWLSFHSAYDFGYLVKIMLCQTLPAEENEFRKYLHTFFPSLYDVKFIAKSVKPLKGGLQDIADDMGIQRIGPQHQAGSDSLLTGHVFFAMRGRYFDGKIEDEKWLNQLWGLNGMGSVSPAVNTAGAIQYMNGQGGQQSNGSHVPSTPTNAMPSIPNTGMTPGPMTPQQQMNPYAQPPPPVQNSQQGVNPMGSGGFQFGKIGGI